MASMTLNGRSDDHPRTLAFTCGRCGQGYGDALYRAPEGHGPANVCLDCWAAEWETRQGLGWERMDIIMYLWSAGGYTQAEIGEFMGKSQPWVCRQIDHASKNFDIFSSSMNKTGLFVSYHREGYSADSYSVSYAQYHGDCRDDV